MAGGGGKHSLTVSNRVHSIINSTEFCEKIGKKIKKKGFLAFLCVCIYLYVFVCICLSVCLCLPVYVFCGLSNLLY